MAAAHFCYLASGALPSQPYSNNPLKGNLAEELARKAGKYTIIGCDTSLAVHKGIADLKSVSGLRLTEIVEYTLLRRFVNASNATSLTMPTGSSLAKSITSMFGWGSTVNNSLQTTSELNATLLQSDPFFKEHVLKTKAVLCPLKIRFAMTLVDLGLTKEAMSYITFTKAVQQEIIAWNSGFVLLSTTLCI